MTRKHLATLLLTLIGAATFQHSYCQKNYVPCYAITQKGDTLNGLVDYRIWGINPNKIRFKTDASSSVQVFTPLDITEFGVSDEIYKGAIVDVEISTDNLNDLDQNSTLHIKKDTTFLQTLVQGPKSLYYYKSWMNKEQFYINVNGEYVLLAYKRYKDNSKEYTVAEVRKYINLLSYYLHDCPSINSKLANLNYNKVSLVDLFNYYKLKTSTEPISRKKSEELSCEFGVAVGQAITTIAFSGKGFEYLTKANFKQSSKLAAGIFLEIIFPYNQKKWSLYNELLYTSYKFTGTYTNVPVYGTVPYYIDTSTIGHSSLSMTNLVRFKYPIGSLFLYINGGVSNEYLFNETNRDISAQVFSNNNYHSTTLLAVEHTRKHCIGYVVGAGAKYQRYSLDFRYGKTIGIADMVYLNSSVKRYYLLVGYRF